MNILVTGDRGYIGSVLTQLLLKKNYNVIGFDIGYFEDCILGDSNEIKEYKSIKKDVRKISKEDLKSIDAIIHLAALSNDPLGDFDYKITEDINFKATIRLAKLAKQTGIKRFIYASTQSIYGISKIESELDEDNSVKNPVTAYAKTKWQSEIELKKICDNKFQVVCFRPSTVFGVSPRLRCDIVFNNFIASAYTTKKIEIKSDGTPWRPVIHVEDVSNAFIAGLEAPKDLINGKSYNIGIKNGNFNIKELAIAASNCIKGTRITFTNEHGKDSRSYKVSFDRIQNELSHWFNPKWNLENGGKQLIDFFKKINFSESDFMGKKTNRLLKLRELREKEIINNNFELNNK